MPLYCPSPQVEESRVGQRLVLFHRGSGKAMVLNPTGASLWGRVGPACSRESLVQWLVDSHPGLSPAAAEGDVAAFLEELLEQGVLQLQS